MAGGDIYCHVATKNIIPCQVGFKMKIASKVHNLSANEKWNDLKLFLGRHFSSRKQPKAIYTSNMLFIILFNCCHLKPF